MAFPNVTSMREGLADRARLGVDSRLGRAFRSYLGTSMHRKAKEWALDAYGLNKGTGGLDRAFRLAFLGYDAYKGYQEGGLGGAALNVAHGVAEQYAMRAAMSAVAPIALPLTALALTAGGLYANKRAIEVGEERYRKHARLEMGTPIVDQFGTAATMRQRSVMALNNSRLNGMTALGNEAALMSRHYFR